MVEIIDKGFEISISEEKSAKAKYYDCLLVNMDDDSHFKWDDLEDDVIKFLELASEAYTIDSIEIEYKTINHYDSFVVMPSELISGKINEYLKWYLSRDTISKEIFIQSLSFFY